MKISIQHCVAVGILLSSAGFSLSAFTQDRSISEDGVLELFRSKGSHSQIIHIPQSHQNINDQLGEDILPGRTVTDKERKEREEESDATAKKQLNIASFLRKLAAYSDKFEVWVEGYSSDNVYIDRSEIKRDFPKGLPVRFDLLTQKQKKSLEKWGGAAVLSVLGVIPPIKGAEFELLNAAAVNAVVAEAKRLNTDACSVIEQTVAGKDSRLKSLILDRRERAAISIIDRGRAQGKISFLIYGGEHDFTNDGDNIFKLKLDSVD